MKKSIGWRKINSTVVAAKISLDIPETSLKSTWTEQIQCLHLDGVSHYCDDKQAIGIFATTTTEKISSAPLLARSLSTMSNVAGLFRKNLASMRSMAQLAETEPMTMQRKRSLLAVSVLHGSI